MFNTKLAPWYIASTIKTMFLPLKLNLEVTKVYWETWHEVFREVK